jgi:hypothetical protein
MITFKCNTVTPTGRSRKGISVFCIVLFLTLVPAEARRSAKGPVELTIYPAKAGEAEEKYQLMVKAEDQIDADAVPLYEKAVKLIPKDFNQEQIREWIKLPAEQLPQEQAEEVLQKCLEPLKLVVRATKCKECNWPELKPGRQADDLVEYRKLAYILELWARLEISRGGYEGATIAMRTGFGMARHVGKGPTILQGLVGSAIGGIMCRELELYLQGKDSLNLYRALTDIPRPLIEMEQAIENERKVALGFASDKFTTEEIEKKFKSSSDGALKISKRADNTLNGLQCVEAIRHFAATHNGQLPEKLSDINQMEVPKDVVNGKEFEYRRTSQGAVLKSAMPEGGGPKDMVHYVIVLGK